MLFDIIIIRKKKNECAAGDAPQLAKQGLVRPDKFEPKVGYQLQAVKYIAKQLYARKLGALRAGSWADQKLDKEHWEEPEAAAVPLDVWTQIRQAGFGANVRNRELRRLWERRSRIRLNIEQGKLVAVKKGKQNLLEEVFEQVKEVF